MIKPEHDKQQNMLEAFYSIFADIDPDTPEEVEEIIQAAGIDPDAYATKIRNLAQDTLAEQARQQIEDARQHYDKAKTIVTEERQSIIQKIQEKLSQLGRKNQDAFSHNRNLESASDTDLQSLLDDLTYLTDSSEEE